MDNALANGYNEVHDPVGEVALDLITHDSDLENEEPDTLHPYIEEWQEEHR